MRKLALLFGAAFIVTAIIAAYLWRQLDESRTQVATSLAEDAQRPLASGLAPRLQSTSGEAVRPQGQLPLSAAAGDARPANPQRSDAALLEGAKRIFSSQEGRDMVQPALRGMVQQRFKGVGKALQLSAAEEDKLLDTLTRQQMNLSAASMDLLAGDTADPGARRELESRVQEMQRTHEAELASTLGSKYPQFEEFESTMAVRQQVEQLNAALGTTGSQLSDAQSRSLVAALAAEQKRITQEVNANPVPAGRSRQEAIEVQIKRMVEANSRLLDTASRHLDSQQLDSYRNILDRQLKMLEGVLGTVGGTP